MKNITLLELDKHKNASDYAHIEDGIYKDLNDTDDTNHRFAISFELEDGEDTQYPMEDILDKYNLYVSDFLVDENAAGSTSKVELGGELEDLSNAMEIVGNRVYNSEYEEDGNTYVNLVIE